MIVVHVTHEAVEKIGGIGTVISGLMTAQAYADAVSRTILLGPLFSTDQPAHARLGEEGRIIYSSLDGIDADGWSEKFRPIERTYDVGIIYGTRGVREDVNGHTCQAEVLLVDVFHANRERLNLFKADLYKMFAVASDRFESVWEYEEYVRLAEPGFEALKVIGADGVDEQVVLLSHEYMGMPTVLKAMMGHSSPTVREPSTSAGQDPSAGSALSAAAAAAAAHPRARGYRTVFYAHEVASARPIVEKTPGHDTMFYNVMSAARREGRTMEEVFPSVFENYKHALVKAARHCDNVFAVGDYIREELQFLDRHFAAKEIDLVYNGIPAARITLEEKRQSLQRMQTYAGNLLGEKPTWIFSHVARPVLSKGIWRDLGVLHEMEPLLAKRGETAVYFMLGTLAGQRRGQDIRHMERVYGWPVVHEEGYPDLCYGEEVLGGMFLHFNREHQAVKVVHVNQWGWARELCGDRMPEDMSFADIRRGTDVEFGMSVYEPFGISQLEPLSFGAMCVPSNICGCVGFAQAAAGRDNFGFSIKIANFLKQNGPTSVSEMLTIPVSLRDEIESAEARRIAALVVDGLCREDAAVSDRISSGYDLAMKMSWQRVVQDYFLPALSRVISVK
ncbi:MAG: hypothetical protein ABFD92_06930 [Planctomycetaceae bacterium]|nr:hypothetical protein [Planctomycetaceae bacterium]